MCGDKECVRLEIGAREKDCLGWCVVFGLFRSV